MFGCDPANLLQHNKTDERRPVFILLALKGFVKREVDFWNADIQLVTDIRTVLFNVAKLFHIDHRVPYEPPKHN